MKKTNPLLICCYACTLGIFTLGMIGKLAAQQTAAETVCFQGEAGKQCVPLSVVRATFASYQDGGAPPTLALRQDLITTQSQLAETLKQFRNCEGTLGPLQADQHSKLLQQQQQLLDNENAMAAPVGMAWDPKQQKYVVKAPETTPAKKGGGL